MKRDMDLIRKIVLATAELPYGQTLARLDGVPEEEFVTHVIWLTEAGLTESTAQAGAGSYAKFALVSRLTWAGCEFADAIADDTLWAKAKDKVLKPGISFTFDILSNWLKAEISKGLPSLL